jgi:8-oxo-dGTP diphosphatase
MSVVRAAGGLVMREGEVLLVHLPRYDDWSFPKGKGADAESDEACVLRAVEGEFAAADEVDEIKWVTPEAAGELLSWSREQPLLERL